MLTIKDQGSAFIDCKPIANIRFFAQDNTEIAILDWSSGELRFEGKADEAAKLFFDYVKQFMDEYIRFRLGNKC